VAVSRDRERFGDHRRRTPKNCHTANYWPGDEDLEELEIPFAPAWGEIFTEALPRRQHHETAVTLVLSGPLDSIGHNVGVAACGRAYRTEAKYENPSVPYDHPRFAVPFSVAARRALHFYWSVFGRQYESTVIGRTATTMFRPTSAVVWCNGPGPCSVFGVMVGERTLSRDC